MAESFEQEPMDAPAAHFCSSRWNIEKEQRKSRFVKLLPKMINRINDLSGQNLVSREHIT